MGYIDLYDVAHVLSTCIHVKSKNATYIGKGIFEHQCLKCGVKISDKIKAWRNF